jgi:hypothetical protein
MEVKLKALRLKLRKSMHALAGDTLKWLKPVVRGYFQYHAVPRNEQRMKAVGHEVLRIPDHMEMELSRDGAFLDGMIRQAALELNLDLPASWLVGDRTVGIQAAPDYIFDNLLAAAHFITGQGAVWGT